MGPEKGHCNVAEIEFYEAGGLLPLSGRIIGTPGCYQQDGSHEYTNAFDGTLWRLDRIGPWHVEGDR